MAVADGFLIAGLLRRQQHGSQHQPRGQQQRDGGPMPGRPSPKPSSGCSPAKAPLKGAAEGAGGGEVTRETGTERRGGHGMGKRTVIQMYW